MTEHVYDTRALTDDQRALADDIASAMGFGHAANCAVWWDESDGCSCSLIQSVADGLNGANVVEVIQEQGYDATIQRGDRLLRRPFRPHPLAIEAEARQQDGSGLRPIEWPNCTTHHGCRCREYAVDYVNRLAVDAALAALPPIAPPALDVESVAAALAAAWLDSNDAVGMPRPPDLAAHLLARLQEPDHD